TCPRACTPASVLPAPVTRTGEPQSFSIASCSAPCTLGPFGCTCQPTKGAPSYSSVSFKDIPPAAHALLRLVLHNLLRGGRPRRASFLHLRRREAGDEIVDVGRLQGAALPSARDEEDL